LVIKLKILSFKEEIIWSIYYIHKNGFVRTLNNNKPIIEEQTKSSKGLTLTAFLYVFK